jgi:hypothetical protein
MKLDVLVCSITCCFLLVGIRGCSSNPHVMNPDDEHEVRGEWMVPVSVEIDLDETLLRAAEEGRLGLMAISAENNHDAVIPAQLDDSGKGSKPQLVLMMPEGEDLLPEFKAIERKAPFRDLMKASVDPQSGQLIIGENEETVLQYNYQTVYENDVIRNGNDRADKIVYSDTMSGIYFEAYLECHPDVPKDTIVTSAIYAIPRSDYIHPLYGLDGALLTNDWPDAGHPHHRGIFWAWPEVKYGSKSGDIYALQTVFARPTGNIACSSGPVYAEVDAENMWIWEDGEAIVRERAIIRVYHSASESRIIDLTIYLLALKDGVTIATRFTNSYGGLNLRMMTPESQEISWYKDEAGSLPLRAWSDFNGIFEGSRSTSGLMVLQHQDNPEYPGDWVEYPELAWVQPTFPTSGTRYALNPAEPLVLRYRLIIHKGGAPAKDRSEKSWDAFHAKTTPRHTF